MKGDYSICLRGVFVIDQRHPIFDNLIETSFESTRVDRRNQVRFYVLNTL